MRKKRYRQSSKILKTLSDYMFFLLQPKNYGLFFTGVLIKDYKFPLSIQFLNSDQLFKYGNRKKIKYKTNINNDYYIIEYVIEYLLCYSIKTKNSDKDKNFDF